MGIQDRDYMKRRGEDGPSRGESADKTLEEFLQNTLRRYPRLPLALGLGLGILLLVAWILIRL